MKQHTVSEYKRFKPLLGGALTAFCGLALWQMPLGEPWVGASYDYLFRFGARSLTNQVVFIQMDDDAYDYFRQDRGQPWDRTLHAQLLQKLAADGCPLVVFDCFFREAREPAGDQALAEALRQQRHVVLMAEQVEVNHRTLAGARPTLPAEPFLSAARTNWGVAWLDPDLDLIVRRQWPFPSPGPYPSLPWAAARLAGARLDEQPCERWLRYYGENGAWTRLSYRFALAQPTNYFRDRIVFVGTQPKTSLADGETDEFLTPYTRWTGETMAGGEIMITAFLNLLNHDWLQRPAWWIEALTLGVVGVLLGGVLCRLRPLSACLAAAGAALIVTLTAVVGSYLINFWFPWLVIVGGQAPCALVWALAVSAQRSKVSGQATESGSPSSVLRPLTSDLVAGAPPGADADQVVPETPDYELFNPPFGEGAYGKVWVARNAIGQWQALKAVYRAKFGEDPEPYEREFAGITRYKPVSDKHPGLLRIDFVSQKKPAGYFYYVMELGDPLAPDWQHTPSSYRPRDLVSARRQAPGQKLPSGECVRIGLALADALDFLHQRGLTHRDIKPQNIIFVGGQPKLADVGLTAEIRPSDQTRTSVGTPGYMPPPPEMPGTPQADLYALGMVLYVLSTGRHPTFFPEISTTLAGSVGLAEFLPLNEVILKACHPDCSKRFKSASEMRQALQGVQAARH